MMYTDATQLPFNGDVLGEAFQCCTPDVLDAGDDGLWVVLRGDEVLLSESGTFPEEPPPEPEVGPVMLGHWHGRPIRAARIAEDSGLDGLVALPLRAFDRADVHIITLAGIARQTLHWEAHTTVCSRCGSRALKTYPRTWGKVCGDCRWSHYPLVLPCTIVLVRDGERFLLARGATWPEGFYSLVAGFVDMGESLEASVRREVREEVGLQIDDLEYVGSQNWPFPTQLMVGFVCDYAGGEIVVDSTELADARWFTRHNLPETLPPQGTISRYIIDRYALG